MKQLSTKAYAKINLGLEIIKKRPDSFHEINTLFARISLHDDIKITESDELSLFCHPELDCKPEENLVYQAAKILQSKTKNKTLSANIELIKNIPHGGGLGGGSSDAASTLIALNELWELKFDKELSDYALQLGSDVPYFLQNGLAVASGRGEELEYIDTKLDYWVLIVSPGIHISTPWAYKALNMGDKIKQKTNYKEVLPAVINDKSKWKEYFENDFEEVIFKEYPILEEIKKRLYDSGSFFALMSGSGSTMFGLFENEEKCKEAAHNFSEKHYICKIVD